MSFPFLVRSLTRCVVAAVVVAACTITIPTHGSMNGVEAKKIPDLQQTVEIDAHGNVETVSQSQPKPTDSSKYPTCESCIEHGWGWNWSLERCGEYMNMDCSEEAAAEADRSKKSSKQPVTDEDDEEDDDEEEVDSDNVVDDDDDDDDDEDDEVEVDELIDRNKLPDIETVKRRIVETSHDNYEWADTDRTTIIWQLVSGNDVDGLRQLIFRDPAGIHLRAKDGRGPLFWAYEYNKKPIIEMLIDLGADEDLRDSDGNTPIDLRPR